MTASGTTRVMLGYTPPQPMFWKALLASAPLVAIVAWSVQLFHIHIPTRVLIVAAIAAWLVIAATIHARISNDWRTQYGLDRSMTDHTTSVTTTTYVDRQ